MTDKDKSQETDSVHKDGGDHSESERQQRDHEADKPSSGPPDKQDSQNENAATDSENPNKPQTPHPTEETNPKKATEKPVSSEKSPPDDKPKRKSSPSSKSAPEKTEEEPSYNQPLLDQYLSIIEKDLGSMALEAAYINRLSKHVPTLVAHDHTYFQVAKLLRYHPALSFNYLSELHGTDLKTHMEVYLHLHSFEHHHSLALKVKIERDNPELETVTSLWEGANWPECEAYDLLGIHFINHPNLKRIFLGEEWEGYPLRKDYEAYDEEV
ncbi:NADH-quinone oxidoreductase subunit C [Thalassobacillus sp. CUG 92003]|uniref:NADH-quinone oxidoreductase subunit C n=1 Tax=Thalassobacillus sp. CUG 92003 TaxID=2736641 RepID=UPI0015E69411|nr:NADH-quinone oxidoreductase subunit C [Thalassobacillus sp. CUG 92003]